ncbi:MAG: enoyl-CoA hydratase-related protein [Pseudomonadota bacterium]
MSEHDGGTVRLEIEASTHGPLAHLTLDHPERRNAMGPAVIASLKNRAGEIAARNDIRAVTLRGQGALFAAGANVKVMARLDPTGARAFITSLHEAIDAVRRLPVPVIAVLQGHCYGAAMELAAACDLRIADTTLIAGMPEVRVGLPSVIEACLLPRLIGWGKTSELLLTGRDVVGEENRQISFVERMSDPASLERDLADWLDQILACEPAAIRAQKQVLLGWQPDDRAGIPASIDAFEATFKTGAPARALARFR